MALLSVSCLFPFLCLSSRNKSDCLKRYCFLHWWSFWQKLKLFRVCGATEIMLTQLFSPDDYAYIFLEKKNFYAVLKTNNKRS